MPDLLGALVTDALARMSPRTAPLGWVFAHARQWGIFLLERSDDPPWPPGTAYLKVGTHVTLPAFTSAHSDDRASGWVRLNGNRLSRPLLVHPVVTAFAADLEG